MEKRKSFEFGALLRNMEIRKPINRPTLNMTVESGAQKRLETNIKNRKSHRLTTYDSLRNLPKCERNLPKCESPKSIEDDKQKHRRQQLEKWKAEKEIKKKELIKNKVKPFLTGKPKMPLKYEPPPPIRPTTSGIVTRSKSSTLHATTVKKPKSSVKTLRQSQRQSQRQSFAPPNATFNPPKIKNLVTLPKLGPPSKSFKITDTIFEPVIPEAVSGRVTRSKNCLTRQDAIESCPSTSGFNSPKINNLKTASKLASPPKSVEKTDKKIEPVIPKTVSGKGTQSRDGAATVVPTTSSSIRNKGKIRSTRGRVHTKEVDNKNIKGQIIKKSPKKQSKPLDSSSSEDVDVNKFKPQVPQLESTSSDSSGERVKRKSMRPTFMTSSGSVKISDSSAKHAKPQVPQLESTSSDSSGERVKRKSMRPTFMTSSGSVKISDSSAKHAKPQVPQLESTSSDSSGERVKRKSMRPTFMTSSRSAKISDSSAKHAKPTESSSSEDYDEIVPQVIPTSSDSSGEKVKRTSLKESLTSIEASDSGEEVNRVYLSSSTEMSDNILNMSSSDVEFIENKSPVSLSVNMNVIPKSESCSEEKLKSPVLLNDVLTPEQLKVAKISPGVTMSRGKDNARRELMLKMKEGYLNPDNCESINGEIFRHQLTGEVTRITALCDHWEGIMNEEELPTPVQEELLAAVGQGRLLVSSKLRQFSGMIDKFELPEAGAPLMARADLTGFWEMLLMAVKNVDMRFKEVEKMYEQVKAKCFVEKPLVAPAPVKPVAKEVRPAAKVAKNVAKGGQGSSKLREMIAAARKAKKDQEASSSAGISIAAPPVCSPKASTFKVFEGGFFSVQSPVKDSPAKSAPSTPLPLPKNDLRKAVLSNEAKKASASKSNIPFAILQASITYAQFEGCALLPQTPLQELNLSATPGRSILKKKIQDNKTTDPKVVKVVAFNSSPDSERDLMSDPYQTCLEEDILKNTNDKENLEHPNIPSIQIEDSPEFQSTLKTRSQKNQTCMEEDILKNTNDKENLEHPNVPSIQNEESPELQSTRKTRSQKNNSVKNTNDKENLEHPNIPSIQFEESPELQSTRKTRSQKNNSANKKKKSITPNEEKRESPEVLYVIQTRSQKRRSMNVERTPEIHETPRRSGRPSGSRKSKVDC